MIIFKEIMVWIKALEVIMKNILNEITTQWHTVYPRKYTHGFVVIFLFVSVIFYFIGDICDVFTCILQGYFTGTGAIIWLPQCQWSKLEEYG